MTAQLEELLTTQIYMITLQEQEHSKIELK